MSRSMRDTMPTVAELVDELRQALGRDVVDRAIRAGMQGKGGFYAAEVVGGRLLEVGSPRDGQRPAIANGGPVWPERPNAWPIPRARRSTPTPTPFGSSHAPTTAGNSSPGRGLLRGPSKGVI